MLDMEWLLELIDNKINKVRDYALKFNSGALDLEAQHASLIFECDIYYYSSDEIVIPIGTKSIPSGISKTTADIIIFINESKQDEKIYFFKHDLKKLIREHASRDNLFFDDDNHNSMCIKLNKNELTNARRTIKDKSKEGSL